MTKYHTYIYKGVKREIGNEKHTLEYGDTFYIIEQAIGCFSRNIVENVSFDDILNLSLYIGDYAPDEYLVRYHKSVITRFGDGAVNILEH